MEPKHRLAGSSKKHSGNDPKYMQNDKGPSQSLDRFTNSVGGHNSAPAKQLQKKPAFYK
jgi:hypothetical protein